MYAEEIVFLIMTFLLLMLFMQYGMRKLLGVDASAKAVFESDGRNVNNVHCYIYKLLGLIVIAVLLVNFFYTSIEYWELFGISLFILSRVVDIVMNWVVQPEKKLHWIMIINTFMFVGFIYLLVELISLGS
ncbi:DUF4181 domain-containing protein [Alkalibacillus haloalkaliphilus]|uniref:DUF4181 domain-containing protein n=1 Tax=Alkalibacillus haloalkaliphilus TaxID=94136 RepID=UPI0029356879|nr:DUF4181 domain-containing protein [Alkalibacillus haloalkaliphilus]MDV2582002.1 DUF4181 domain-containing protein [Alkalibacillus haloalkaliphilus]